MLKRGFSGRGVDLGRRHGEVIFMVFKGYSDFYGFLREGEDFRRQGVEWK